MKLLFTYTQIKNQDMSKRRTIPIMNRDQPTKTNLGKLDLDQFLFLLI